MRALTMGAHAIVYAHEHSSAPVPRADAWTLGIAGEAGQVTVALSQARYVIGMTGEKTLAKRAS